MTLSSTVYIGCCISLIDGHRYDIYRERLSCPSNGYQNVLQPVSKLQALQGLIGQRSWKSFGKTSQVLNGLMHGILLTKWSLVNSVGQTFDAKRRLLSTLMAGCDILSVVTWNGDELALWNHQAKHAVCLEIIMQNLLQGCC